MIKKPSFAAGMGAIYATPKFIERDPLEVKKEDSSTNSYYHDVDLKAKAIELLLDGNHTPRQVADITGIPHETLKVWKVKKDPNAVLAPHVKERRDAMIKLLYSRPYYVKELEAIYSLGNKSIMEDIAALKLRYSLERTRHGHDGITFKITGKL